MKYILLSILVTFTSFSQLTFAEITSDNGKITQLFVSTDGNIAVIIEGGFPNARSKQPCRENTQWAGVINPSSNFVSAILTANATGAPLTVAIEGCAGENSGWFNIKDIYFR